MKTTIDKFGRFVIPKDIRDRLGLKPGVEIEIEAQEGEVVIRQKDHQPTLQLEDGVLVFSGTATADLSESVRRQREGRIAKMSTEKRI